MLRKKRFLPAVLISLGILVFPAFSSALFEDPGGEKLGDNPGGADVSVLPSILLFNNAHSYYALGSKREIVDTYCKAALSDKMTTGRFLFSGHQINFNSRNSLFVRSMCHAWNNGDPREGRKDTLVEKKLLEDVFKDIFQGEPAKQLQLQQQEGTRDVCLTSSNDECDVARYSSKVYTSLLSDIFKIKRAHFLQVESVKTFTEKGERVAKVFETLFATQHMVSNKGEYLVLFPKTAEMIDNNQQFFQKSLQTLIMLDNDKLAELASEEISKDLTKCHMTGAIVGFLCGLHMPNSLGTDQHFINFITNEYLNYRLFIDYYANQQQKRLSENRNLSDLNREGFMVEIKSLFAQRDMYEQALRIALTDFQDFVATYPIHLGFVRYQEQLLKFRDIYATNMVTPFYSLYEKLRNVQPPEK